MERLASLFDGARNLSLAQRAAYIVGGLGLAAAGAQPRPNPLLNVVALAAGSYLAWSGYKGRCPAKAMIAEQHNPAAVSHHPGAEQSRLRTTEA